MKYKFLCCFILLVIGLSPMTLAYSTSYSWSVLDSSIETSAQSSANVQNDNFLNLDAESAILIEQNSGQILYSHNIHEKLHPASVTKIMSLLLIMEALDSGKITLETQIPCSENAANMGGSQIWLDPRENLSVNDMLKAIAVVSANDCVTAMAEYLGGSTENFVKMMNEKAKELGICGITNAVEDVIVARDILLAKETGVHLHLCHCSTKDSVKMVRIAKKDGVSVSAEVCPHHFAMTEDEIAGDDANYKMNPPLRSAADVEALVDGLADGTMEAISTDHAPHGEEEKKQSIAKAPFGIVGSETAYALSVTHLVKTGKLTPLQLVEKMSTNPCRILSVPGGTLSVGAPADITIADMDSEYVIDKNTFLSKGKNTPFDGAKVNGRVYYTIVGGNIVYQYE